MKRGLIFLGAFAGFEGLMLVAYPLMYERMYQVDSFSWHHLTLPFLVILPFMLFIFPLLAAVQFDQSLFGTNNDSAEKPK